MSVSIHIHINAFLTALKKKKYKPQSIDAYRDRLKKFRAFLDVNGVNRVQDVTSTHLEDFKEYLVNNGLAEVTLESSLRCLRLFFNYLEDNQEVFINPTEGLIISCNKPVKLQVPPEDDIQKLLKQPNIKATTGIRDRAIMEVAYQAGLPLKELCHLDIFDPDLNQQTLHIKGQRKRTIDLSKSSISWLKKYLAVRSKLVKSLDEHALWISRVKGKRLSRIRLGGIFIEYSQKAGIDPFISIKSLRYACALRMLEQGVHPLKIQQTLGLLNLKSLAKFLRTTITDLKKR